MWMVMYIISRENAPKVSGIFSARARQPESTPLVAMGVESCLVLGPGPMCPAIEKGSNDSSNVGWKRREGGPNGAPSGTIDSAHNLPDPATFAHGRIDRPGPHLGGLWWRIACSINGTQDPLAHRLALVQGYPRDGPRQEGGCRGHLLGRHQDAAKESRCLVRPWGHRPQRRPGHPGGERLPKVAGRRPEVRPRLVQPVS